MDILAYEKKYWEKNVKYVAGIDEAGRGPLAGPVVAACVIFDKNIEIQGIADSKKISPKKRLKLYHVIREKAIDVSVGIANEHEIDKLNILQATFLAMKRSVGNLKVEPQQLLIDGPYSDIKLYSVETIIKGDSKSLSVAAASIIAKVTRDKIMEEYHEIYPDFGFNKHKGYGTKLHIEQLSKIKATPIHRKSFNIVKNHLPTFDFYKNQNYFHIVGAQLVATQFIKKGFNLIDKNIVLSDLDDCIDYCYCSNKEQIYVRVITKYDNKYYPKNDKPNIDIKKNVNNIRKLSVEKETTKKISFNVILVEFITGNKPIITLLENEKIN